MGKALIIKGADFSANAIGQITPSGVDVLLTESNFDTTLSIFGSTYYYIGVNGTLIQSTSTDAYGYFVSVGNYKGLNLELQPKTNFARFSFVKQLPTSSSVSFADGYSTSTPFTTVNSSSAYTGVVPSDAEYMYVQFRHPSYGTIFPNKIHITNADL